jgi:hypothetical protein
MNAEPMVQVYPFLCTSTMLLIQNISSLLSVWPNKELPLIQSWLMPVMPRFVNAVFSWHQLTDLFLARLMRRISQLPDHMLSVL